MSSVLEARRRVLLEINVDRERLAAVRGARTAVRVLTDRGIGPTTRQAIADFCAGFADAQHVVWDALSTSALRQAYATTQAWWLKPGDGIGNRTRDGR